MEYAFRAFAAIYGYRVLDQNSVDVERTFFYGAVAGSQPDPTRVVIPARYQARPKKEAARPALKIRHSGEEFHLFHGIDQVTQTPDWLGEIFEWLSSSLERSIGIRDSVGRIPDSAMHFHTAQVAASKPQAAMLMAWLEQESRGSNREEALPRAPSPIKEAEHLVVCSHDIDFYHTDRKSTFQRLLKNLGISVLIYKSWSYFYSNSSMLAKMLRGDRVGDYLPDLLERLEAIGSRSTLFVVPLRGHRRDPNYALAELGPQLSAAAKRGFAVEIHGSYKSIIENHALNPEAQALHAVTGKVAVGSRQHWLRYDDPDSLCEAIEDAGLLFDSSMGFTDTVGFRNGACFAFPPYNFKDEKPHNFLEIPLAIMDGALFEESRNSGISPQRLADQVLFESRKRGWGGISILWHNPMEALSVPEEINQVFWKCAESQSGFHEKWVSTDQFLAMCLQRYQDAGLLKGSKLNS